MQAKSKIKNQNQKQKTKSKMNKGLLFTFYFLLFTFNASAQCAMCRASLESNGDTKQAEAVNDGIVYLMAIPYVLVGLLGFIIYRMFAKKK
jgi:phosphatidylglycerophosphatase A